MVAKSFRAVLLITLILHMVNISAQTRNIYAVVNGNNVTLWQTFALRNCGAAYRMEIEETGNHIDWFQVDTGATALCLCVFDLSVTIGPMDPGYYEVDVYYTEAWSPEDTIYEGSTSFTISKIGYAMRSEIISQYQSDCYSGVGVADNEKEFENIFNIYPVPLKDGEIVNLEVIPAYGQTVLEIFTLTGVCVYSKHYDGNQPIHDRWMKDELFPVSGLYLARLRTPDHILIKKITVL